jgi:hypothetical protein
MNRAVVTTALAAGLALAALATVVGSARATYPEATNGRLAFGMNVGGNVDVYSVRPDGQDLRPSGWWCPVDSPPTAASSSLAYPTRPLTESTRARSESPSATRPRAAGGPSR